MDEPALHSNASQRRSSGSDFAKLLVRYQSKLRLYVRAMVFNQSDVDDIVQECAAKAFARFDQYDPAQPFDAWLITIARYEVMTYLKRLRREKVVFSSEVIDRLTQTMQREADRWTRYSLDSLEACMERLDTADRRLVHMRYAEGKLGKQIASALAVSEATVCRRLARVYGQLLVCIRRKAQGVVA
ncbi:MAG: sigma-70 family RNA polymerase sigma factor [Phycisphaeraceae bacterium]